jgi:hypothetical protein
MMASWKTDLTEPPRGARVRGRAAAMLLAGIFFASACGSNPSATAGKSSTEPLSNTEGSRQAAPVRASETPLPADTAAPSATPTIVETSTPTITPTQFAANPITGEAVEDPASVLRRPIGIKVTNYPRTARPQAGLTSADLLFEYYQEKGDTRFHAVYLSREEKKVGPLRSARVVDARLEQIFQSIFVFNAADFRVWDWYSYQEVRRNTLTYGPAECPAICIDDQQAEINRFYANTAELRKTAKERNITDIVPDLSGWTFQEETPPMGSEAPNMRVRFLTNWAIAEWRYNPNDHLYYRWSDTDQTPLAGTGPLNLGKLIDRNNKQQITASNLVVLWMNYNHITNEEIYDVNFYGSGAALFFRDGKMEEGSWRMPNSTKLPHFYGNSKPGSYLMRPGVSWIALVDDQSKYAMDGDTLKVEFSMPG